MHTSAQHSSAEQEFDRRTDRVIDSLLAKAEQDRFKGYDPYDILKSPLPFRAFGTFVAAVATQLHKRNPVNIRPMLGIRKDMNPKAVGLLLDAVSRLQQLRPNHDYRKVMTELCDLAEATVSKGYSGACWGYDFGWASPGKYLPPFAPSGVVTAFVVKGLYHYHQLTGDRRARQLVESAADFVMKDLPHTSDATGVAISYTPFKRDICYNASLLAADTLARAFSLSPGQEWKDVAVGAARFVIARQKADGRWNYSLDEASGREREQIDFHQGYVIDALHSVSDLTGASLPGGNDAVRKGLVFYRNKQFTADGRSLWRYPKEYPVDIHNQSQGIITFSRAARSLNDPGCADFARKVAGWTLDNMFDDRRASFHYRKYPLFTNRIPYLRWSNAWMLVALVELKTTLRRHP